MSAESVFQVRSLDAPDHHRPFVARGAVDVVTIGATTFGRARYEPGWRWSVDVKPLAGTDSCQAMHVGYVLSGRMHIALLDGRAIEIGPGDAFVIPPGHDAWTLGDEACVLIDVTGMADFARAAA